MKTVEVPELSESVVEKLERSPVPYLISDSKLPGFFLKVGARDLSWTVRRKFQGTTRLLTIGTYPATRAKDIRPLARKYLSDLELGTHPKEKSREIRRVADEKRAASHWTLGHAFDWYLAAQDSDAMTRLEKSGVGVEPCPRKKPLADTSLKSYRSAKARFEKAGFGKTPVADLTPESVMKAHAKMLEGMDPKRAKAGGGTQAAQAMRCARAVVRALIPMHLKTARDPFAEIPRARKWDEPKPKNRTILEKEGSLSRWWKAVDALRSKTDGRAKDAPAIADWLQLTLLFGCRRAETQTMMWSQVDFSEGLATFDKTKNGRPHAVPFGPHARAILERRRSQADESGDDSPFVFPATRTGYVSKTRTCLRQTKAAESEVIAASGVDFTAHDLRRTSASLLGEAGVGVYQLKAALNHAASGQDVTERHYIRVRLKALRSVFERLEEAILEEAGVRPPDDGGLEALLKKLLLKAKEDPEAREAMLAALAAAE
jgi:integrase